MKKTKIVIPALAVLLLSTAASVSGTVAWFSMNTAINVTGMSVTTRVSSSLQIAETNAEANFSNENLTQARSGILEPASTVDGDAFYYTTDAKANGDARQDSYVLYDEDTSIRNGDNPATTAHEENFSNALGATDEGNNPSDAKRTGKVNYDPKFHAAYGFGAYDATANSGRGNGEVPFAYIDYSFYLKAFMQNSEFISLTTCNMKYNNGSLGQEHAWRVAFFAHKVNLGTQEDNATTTGTAANLISILNFAESKNQNQANKSVELNAGVDLDSANPKYYTDAECTSVASGTSNAGTYYLKGDQDPKAVNAVDGLGFVTGYDDVNHENKEAKISVASTGNYVFKVVVRLWLEGEDITCRSDTFATLDQAWTLDLGFKLGSEAGVKNITNTLA